MNLPERESINFSINKRLPVAALQGSVSGGEGSGSPSVGLRGGMSSRNARREMEGPAQGAGREAGGDGSGARSAGRGRARRG